MNRAQAIEAIRESQPIVIESRKFGIVADWYSTRDKNEFAGWLRARFDEGAYPPSEYNRTWRAWRTVPTAVQRRERPWITPTMAR